MKRYLKASLALLTAFVLWTAAVGSIDVRAIGPKGSKIGFSTVNEAFSRLTGVHMTWYVVTDWLSLVPVAFALGFALLGLTQWIGRKKLQKVDFSILTLGGFYLVVLVAYVLFEKMKINYRPVLIDGALEASYPSSTTMLVLCIMITAEMQLCSRIKNRALKHVISVFIGAFILFMVISRLTSGVHWLSDIIGAILLSAGLVTLYTAVCKMK